jgi:spore maturation protein CgeB
MRILILGAGGPHRTEASLARAARSLGHTARVVDARAWRRSLRGLAPRLARWRIDHWAPDFVLCTRHAIALGEEALSAVVRRREAAFWYFDAAHPLQPEVVGLARLTGRVFATYGYQAEAFRAAGLESRFLPQGMDPEIDRPSRAAPARYRCDVSFIGSGHYPRRYEVLGRVAAAARLQIRGPRWEQAPGNLPVAGGVVRGRAFSRVVRGAALSLGIDALAEQRRERLGGTSNRLWRVLGAGGCFLGEWVEGVERFARGGEHALWYRTADEAVELARCYLGNSEDRERIARAGHAEAAARHTYAHRLALLLAGQGYTST